MLSEIRLDKANAVCFYLYVESKKKKAKQTKQNMNRLIGLEKAF